MQASGILGAVRVSTKSDYALRALIEITRRDDVVSAEQVGASQDIPHGFLQSILADLRRAGLVASQRGQSGGWRMAADPADVSVADVIRAVDGPLLSVYGVRPESVSYNESADGAADRVGRRAHSLRSVLETVTIDALASGSLPDDVVARTVDEDAWNPH